jgi:hypothetical protein
MQKPNCSFSFDLEKYTHQDVMVEQKPKKTSGKITHLSGKGLHTVLLVVLRTTSKWAPTAKGQ